MMKFSYGSVRLLFMIFISAFALSSCKSKKIISDNTSQKGGGSLRARYATILDVPEKEIKNDKLYRFLDEWMGVPYRDAGMDKNGLDCSGFVTIIQKEVFNRSVPRVAGQMAQTVKRKYEDELEEGDLVFFDFKGRKFSHVGVYLRNNRFAHASTSKGVVISNLKDPWYYKYFSRAGSMKDATYSVID